MKIKKVKLKQLSTQQLTNIKGGSASSDSPEPPQAMRVKVSDYNKGSQSADRPELKGVVEGKT